MISQNCKDVSEIYDKEMTTLLIEFRQNYLGTDLVATLTGLNMDDFSHVEVKFRHRCTKQVSTI